MMTTIGMKTRKRFGSWNVLTLSESSKLAQAEREMERYNLLFLGLSEVRWPECGEQQTSGGYTFIYSGKSANEPRSSGVGFLLSKEAKKSLIEWQPHGDRIIVIKLKTKARNLSCIQCYAPTDTSDRQIKDEFYCRLNSVMTAINEGDIKILMGDFNAQIGADNRGREAVIGKHGIGRMTENGELFCETCANYKMVIGGTIFPHKKIHKVTWVSNDKATENQIDHIAISKMWRHSLLDVRNRRGADIGSDHHLVVGEVQLKICANKCNKPKRREKFNLERLKNRETLLHFSNTLKLKIEPLKNNMSSLDTYWKQAGNAFLESAKNCLGNSVKKVKPWISDQTWNLIENRREVKLCINNTKTRQAKLDLQQQYNIANRKVKRSARNDKRKWAENLAAEAQRANETNRSKDVYRITKLLAGHNHTNMRPLRNVNGELEYTKEGQLRVWVDHYRNILDSANENELNEFCQHTQHTQRNDINTQPPSYVEITEAIISLKDHKAAGPDNMPPELFKADKSLSTSIIQPLVEHFWQTESLPSALKEGLIINIPKKGNQMDCKNWRGITLLNMLNKIISRILFNRMSAASEPELRKEQAGFRPNRSCIDHINSLRIITEQTAEWQSNLYLIFIDFQRAFDSLHHSAIWKAMQCKRIPDKIIRLVKCLYANATCSVLHEGQVSDNVNVKVGVRQGCVLSPLLFNIVLDVIMSQSVNAIHGITFGMTGRLIDLDYADDICLLSHNHQGMQQMLNNITAKALNAGLIINISKTKSMRFNVTSNYRFSLMGKQIEDVTTFCYLGSIIATSGGCNEDIQNRLTKAKQAFGILNKFWRSANIAVSTKIKVFNSNVKSVLLYGSETWNLTSLDVQKLQVFVNKCLRRILKIFWPQTITNSELWFKTQQPPIDHEIKIRKYRWLGHTLRKPADDINKKSLDYNPQGARRRGRPKNTWRRQVQAELQTAGITWNEAKSAAQDRNRWRSIIEALCSL